MYNSHVILLDQLMFKACQLCVWKTRNEEHMKKKSDLHWFDFNYKLRSTCTAIISNSNQGYSLPNKLFEKFTSDIFRIYMINQTDSKKLTLRQNMTLID